MTAVSNSLAFLLLILSCSYYVNAGVYKVSNMSSEILSERVHYLTIQVDPIFMDSRQKRINKIKMDGGDGAPRPIFLDVAVNKLVTDLVIEKLQREKDIYATEILSDYYDESGIPELKEAAAGYFTKYFQSVTPVSPDNLCFVTSVNGCMDVLAHSLADPGDVFIAFTPVFNKAPPNFYSRSKVEIWPAPMLSDDGKGNMSFHLSLEKIKKSFDAAVQANRTVKGLFLINPGNPVGDVITPELMMEILQFAAQRKLHVIVDEIYALFLHSMGATFRSVLSLPNLPDPRRTHMIYGLSKDFGLTAWRVGIIYSLNAPLIKTLRVLAGTQCLPLPIMNAATKIFNDHDWIDRLMAVTPKRATLNYEYATNRLKGMGLLVRDTVASLFVWCYMGSVMKEVTFKEELAVAKYLQDNAYLYIAPGQKYLSSDPGWFRIIFTVPAEDLVEGMDRLQKYVDEMKLEKD